MYKKILVFALMILALVNFQPLGAIYTDDPVQRGDELTMFVNLENELNYKLKDVRVKALIYDLGEVVNSNDFDMPRGDTSRTRLTWDVPQDIEPGEYVVRVTASN